MNTIRTIMKKIHILFLLLFLAQAAALFLFVLQDSDFRQDTVAVNEAIHSVQNDWGRMAVHQNRTDLDYTVLDRDGTVLFRTRSGLRETINQAVIYGDTILDIEIKGSVRGKLILYNGKAEALRSRKYRLLFGLLFFMLFQLLFCMAYFLYLRRTLVNPFHQLKDFAQRVAGGNLDIPLAMDRHNSFGAFTESFDLMRSQLKQSRIAEAKANTSKKELVAKLSHDIRTPVASIKAAAEVGAALSDGIINHPPKTPCPTAGLSGELPSSAPSFQAVQNRFVQIIRKADQINSLVTELFTATLEELQQLPVSPSDLESGELHTFLENSDYLHKGSIPPIPSCLLFGDRLRLQQVFDNIFANSYKYADSSIDISVFRTDRYLAVSIKDYGGGICDEELPLIKEKFRRGSNSRDIDGAGLGLYISDYFMKEMNGMLTVENSPGGLNVTVKILLSGAQI